jgi:hypothetical protein
LYLQILNTLITALWSLMENKLTDVDDLKRCFSPRQAQQYTGTSDFQPGY